MIEALITLVVAILVVWALLHLIGNIFYVILVIIAIAIVYAIVRPAIARSRINRR